MYIKKGFSSLFCVHGAPTKHCLVHFFYFLKLIFILLYSNFITRRKKAKTNPDTFSRHVDRNLNTKQRNRYRINKEGLSNQATNY